MFCRWFWQRMVTFYLHSGVARAEEGSWTGGQDFDVQMLQRVLAAEEGSQNLPATGWLQAHQHSAGSNARWYTDGLMCSLSVSATSFRCTRNAGIGRDADSVCKHTIQCQKIGCDHAVRNATESSDM
jgi:hypothetical protein